MQPDRRFTKTWKYEAADTAYGDDEALPGVPTSGSFIPSRAGVEVEFQASALGTTIELNDGAYFELSDGTRYTCTSPGGCTVVNGAVTRGAVAGRAPGSGETEVDRFSTFRTAAAPGEQSFTVGTTIDTLTLPEASGGNGDLTYSLAPDVPGLTFNPGTTDEFSVNARLRGSLLVRLAGISVRFNNETIDGRVYDFEASHQGDGVWRIERIADNTEAPANGGDANGGANTSPRIRQRKRAGRSDVRGRHRHRHAHAAGGEWREWHAVLQPVARRARLDVQHHGTPAHRHAGFGGQPRHDLHCDR